MDKISDYFEVGSVGKIDSTELAGWGKLLQDNFFVRNNIDKVVSEYENEIESPYSGHDRENGLDTNALGIICEACFNYISGVKTNTCDVDDFTYDIGKRYIDEERITNPKYKKVIDVDNPADVAEFDLGRKLFNHVSYYLDGHIDQLTDTQKKVIVYASLRAIDQSGFDIGSYHAIVRLVDNIIGKGGYSEIMIGKSENDVTDFAEPANFMFRLFLEHADDKDYMRRFSIFKDTYFKYKQSRTGMISRINGVNRDSVESIMDLYFKDKLDGLVNEPHDLGAYDPIISINKYYGLLSYVLDFMEEDTINSPYNYNSLNKIICDISRDSAKKQLEDWLGKAQNNRRKSTNLAVIIDALRTNVRRSDERFDNALDFLRIVKSLDLNVPKRDLESIVYTYMNPTHGIWKRFQSYGSDPFDEIELSEQRDSMRAELSSLIDNFAEFEAKPSAPSIIEFSPTKQAPSSVDGEKFIIASSKYCGGKNYDYACRIKTPDGTRTVLSHKKIPRGSVVTFDEDGYVSVVKESS